MQAETGKDRLDAPRVAVLGGTGWLGRHICDAFSRCGYEIVVVAREPAQHVSAHTFVELDLALAESAAIGRLLSSARAGIVVNATDAANATDGWVKTEEEMAVTNVGLVQRLLTAMSSLPWRSRIVHVGTIHEYGEVAAGTSMDEKLRPDPRTPYTRTKLAGSEAVLNATRAGELDGLVLRSANISGPHPSPASFPGKLVRMLSDAAGSRQRMAVSITDARRDFVDVRDVADAVLKAAETLATGRVVNIGSGAAVDMRTLVRLFVTAAGFSPDMIEEEHGEVRSLGGSWTQVDIRLAEVLLGWKPQISLTESLRAMWEEAVADRRSNT
jgi:nucleoside-diphosphate-sugar epimerase